MANKIRMYLYHRREELGYSMRKVAKIGGLSFQHYSCIENGDRLRKISFVVIIKIANALKLSLDYIAEKEIEYLSQYIKDEEDSLMPLIRGDN